MTRTLFILGYGYTARFLAKRLSGWQIYGTTRSQEKATFLLAENVTPLLWPGDDLRTALAEATHLLVSLPPSNEGDPFLAQLGSNLAKLAPHVQWLGYLSTTGVYGDHRGAWVNETTPVSPSSSRGHARVLAEAQWHATGLPTHIFRLAGIYGPHRSAFDRLHAGTAQRIIKQGQVFSRIHVEDIAQTLHTSMLKPNPGRTYNVTDDLPAPPQDAITHAAHLLGISPPPEIPFEEAELSPMARSFYTDNRRVSNTRIKNELGISLKYPTYREGLAALLNEHS